MSDDERTLKVFLTERFNARDADLKRIEDSVREIGRKLDAWHVPTPRFDDRTFAFVAFVAFLAVVVWMT